ncbi:MAG TPA: glutaminyl-peptide cyclotransferase [Gemmatimonadaceae bacterium]|nr:glutaminyl-peptide cyclotransferase [Gemmatimonadaceae bacterium]
MTARRIVTGAAFAIATLAASCANDRNADSGGRASILPAFLDQRDNADASVPRVPFSPATPRLVPRVLRRVPHDTLAFTQGLVLHDGRLLESTGLEGHSSVRELDRTTGRVLRRSDVNDHEFGEGIAALGDRIYQLTWKSHRGFVYDARTFAPVDSFTYDGEGWGLTSDGTHLYLSDGTSGVRVIDPNGFRVVRTIRVTEAETPVHMLNELEWVKGELWANVYWTGLIARIDPATGRVVGWVDVRRLLPEGERKRLESRGGVANGIAYDSATGQLLVTGKYWPFVFQLDNAALRPDRATARVRSAPRE